MASLETLQEKFPQLKALKTPEAVEKEIEKALTFYYGVIETLELRAEGPGSTLEHLIEIVGGNTKAMTDALADVGKSSKETIEQLKAIFSSNQKSQVKGKNYEQIIYNELVANFKDDVVELVANTTKSADIRFIVTESNTPILIDTKNYATTVSKKEIDKLKRDMERNGDHYGMLVSTNGIAGHKRLDIELCEGGTTILYVPNVGETRCEVIWAILLLKRIIALEAANTAVAEEDAKAIIEKSRELFSEFEERCIGFGKLITKYEKMSYDIASKLEETKNDLDEQKKAMMKTLKKYAKALKNE